jgi:hypothetical protein
MKALYVGFGLTGAHSADPCSLLRTETIAGLVCAASIWAS